MADITLRDRNGAKVNYPGIDIIKLNTSGGDVQNYGAFDPETLTPDKLAAGVTVGGIEGTMTAPEIVENMPIALDFSGGNQSIVAPDGVAVKSAIIQKPETLTPENIAEGVNIAGILGTLTAGGGGGGNIVCASGSISGATDSEIIVNHNLGVVPDIVMIFANGKTTLTSGYSLCQFVAFSIAFYTAIGKIQSGFFVGMQLVSASAQTYKCTQYSNTSNTSCIDHETSVAFTRRVRNADDASFTILNGSGSVYLDASLTYTWIAIGGLT